MFRVFRLFWDRRHALTGAGVRVKACIVFALLLWFATSGFLYFELPGKPDLGWLDALWWAVVTMATVGYGDLFPVTAGGRYLVGVPTMVFGIGFLGYLISEIAGTLIEFRSRRLRGMVDITSKHHLLLINFPRLDTVLKMVRELKADPASQSKDICIVDEFLEELPQELAEMGIQFVKGDPTREDVLRRANLGSASHAIVLARNASDPHSDDHNLVTTLVIEKLNPEVFTVVEVLNAEKIRQVELAGADSTVCASQIASGLIVQEMHDPGIKDILMDLASDLGGNQFYFVPIRAMETWEYRELRTWGITHACTVVGFMREGKPSLNCEAGMKLEPGDLAILIAQERKTEIDTRSA